MIPAWFAHVHPRYRSPDVAIISYAAIAFAFSVTSTFEALAVLSNVAVLLMYFLCCAACWILVQRDVRADGSPFNFPGARFVPALAVVAIVWILAHATVREFAVNGAVLIVASLLYCSRQLEGVWVQQVKAAVGGAIIGGFIAFLVRPSLLGHQVAFVDVITAGAYLKGNEQLWMPLAQTSLNFLIAGVILGGLTGFAVAHAAKHLRISLK